VEAIQFNKEIGIARGKVVYVCNEHMIHTNSFGAYKWTIKMETINGIILLNATTISEYYYDWIYGKILQVVGGGIVIKNGFVFSRLDPIKVLRIRKVLKI